LIVKNSFIQGQEIIHQAWQSLTLDFQIGP